MRFTTRSLLLPLLGALVLGLAACGVAVLTDGRREALEELIA